VPSFARLSTAALSLVVVATATPAFLACALEDAGELRDDASFGPDGSSLTGEDGNGGGPDTGGGGPDTGLEDPDAALVVFDASPPDASLPPPEGPFALLSEAGLYSDIASHTVLPGVLEFEPEFELWSDAAAKRRWIRLPPGTRINSNNMDRWTVPRGTIAYKEFSDPLTGKRLETRVIQRLSSGAFYFAAYIWNEDDTEAVRDATTPAEAPLDIPAGCSECDSPPCASFPRSCHVVPRADQCIECHGGQSHRLLGFSAVQLSHDGPGVTLTDLADLDLLTSPPPDGVDYPVPGTAVERAAIGTLHANCGHCHASSAGQSGCYALTNVPTGRGLQTRVLVGDATVEDTAIWRSAVGRDLGYWVDPPRGNHTAADLGELMTQRIAPGDASRSAIWYRMSVREWGQVIPYDDHQQMPYFATNEVDEDGLGAVEVWINSLP
jgi:hypothetical protein